MDFLAFKITLKGWNRFRGGLNIKDDLTGKESYYNNHRGFEIMFHVSTLIPFQPHDAQQVERKRHLGNDVVVVVFQESDVTEPFDPAKMKSQFNHVFCVVRPTGTPENRSYKIAFTNKLGTQPYGPVLPAGGVYPKGDSLREFLLAKLINGERAAMYAPDFKGKGVRTRVALLQDIIKRYPEAGAMLRKESAPANLNAGVERSPSSPSVASGASAVKGFIGKIFKRTNSVAH